MRKVEPILLGLLALILVLVVYSLVKGTSYAPTQTTNTTSVENLNSDLKALDAIDLDTGTDAQLNQLSQDSSSF